MELSSYIVWNIVLTLVVAPVLYAIRANSTELKRLDILINKTREEMAKDYVSRDTFEYDMDDSEYVPLGVMKTGDFPGYRKFRVFY